MQYVPYLFEKESDKL